MYHILINHSFVVRNLGYFYFLVFVNRVAMNITVEVSTVMSRMLNPLRICQRVVKVHHMVDLFLDLLRILHTGFHNDCASLAIPPMVNKDSLTPELLQGKGFVTL